jgi:ribosome-binding protein aMBF1 (putative translation factor)
MKFERVQKKTAWTEADRERRRKIREQFADKPSVEELVRRGEISGNPTTMETYLTVKLLLSELRKAREAAGLSLADLAERCGIDRSALCRLENGQQSNPTVETLSRYARGLGKQLAWVIQEAQITTLDQ